MVTKIGILFMSDLAKSDRSLIVKNRTIQSPINNYNIARYNITH